MLSKKPWQAEYVLMFIGAQMMGLCLFVLVAMVLHRAKAPGFVGLNDFGFMVFGTLGVQGLACVLIPFFLRLHRIGWREAFGLNQPGWPKSLLLAAGVMLLTLPVVGLLENICVTVLTRLGHAPDNQEAVDMFLNAKTNFARGYFIFFAVVLAPLAEEFIFRGVLYPFVKERGRPRLALFGVSAMFALIHFDIATFIPLFVLALVLTCLYERTNCLLASITAHSLFNASNVILLVYGPEIVQGFYKYFHVKLAP